MAVRQTSCRHCRLDIENFSPYRKGEWRDRGSNTHCPSVMCEECCGNPDCCAGHHPPRLHAPYIEKRRFVTEITNNDRRKR